MAKIKILTIFGTRPEVIKLAPLLHSAANDPHFVSVTCATTQHRELQNDVLNFFRIKTDYDLNIMKMHQDLFYLTTALLEGLKGVLEQEQPDYVIVQGDTTTAFVGALGAFYKKIP
jgi:UDP-N-acetylglucosamine 2-epimerase